MPDRHYPTLFPDYTGRVSAAATETLPHHLRLGSPDAVSAAGYLRHPLSRYWGGTYPPCAEHHTVQASIGVGNARISVDLSTTGVGAEKGTAARSLFWLGTGNDQPNRNRPELRKGSAQTNRRAG